MVRTLDPVKRKAIIAAARAHFLRDGYEAVKVSNIASEAGIASGTLYLYFKSKEALAAAIGEDFFARLGEHFTLLVENFSGPDSVEQLIDWALSMADQEREVLALARQGALGSLSDGKVVFVHQLSVVLKNRMSVGIIRHYPNPETLAAFVANMLRWVVVAYSTNEDQMMGEVRKTTVDVLQHALFDDLTLAAYRLLERKNDTQRTANP